MTALVGDALDLWLAISQNNISVFDAVLRGIPDINAFCRQWDAFYLRFALFSGRMHMAQALVDKGVDPNDVPDRGEHILQRIWKPENARDVVVFLLRNGTRVPRTPPVYIRGVVEDVVCAPWAPENHLQWPKTFRTQARTLMLLRHRISLPPALLAYLLRILAWDSIGWI